MKKNILWVDDQVNTMSLLPDKDELEDRGYSITPVAKVDAFLEIIKDGVRKIDCVIVDMLMAPDSLDLEETVNGTRTGCVLIKKMKESSYKDVPSVVYSVFKNKDDITAFCRKYNNIQYLDKTIKSKDFADRIDTIINGTPNGHENQ